MDTVNTNTIYIDKLRDSLDKATAGLRAWAILRNGTCIGRAIIKHGPRTRAWLYLDGYGWRHGSAGGYGYDKAGAAMSKALPELLKDDGSDWERQLEAKGYKVEYVI